MLAIAGAVTWISYAVFVYGISGIVGGNYTFGSLIIPGKFVLGSPAPDKPSSGSSSGSPTPCTAAQIAAGGKNDASGNCIAAQLGKGPVTLPAPKNCPSQSVWGVAGYATKAKCEKATGLGCIKCYGSWKGFNGNVNPTTPLLAI
jgi:hypothetical protein